MTSWALKKFQYGYHGKNGKVSDQTERTYWEYYSSNYYFSERMEILKLNERSAVPPIVQDPNFLQVDPVPLLHMPSPPKSGLHKHANIPNTPEYSYPRRNSIDF